MFWTMEKFQNFADENSISVDDALKGVQLAYFVTGISAYYLFMKFSKSPVVKKIFEKWRKHGYNFHSVPSPSPLFKS